MEAEAVKRAVKDIVLRHAPDAEVILYGSRARGDAQPDSDWDILVLLPFEPTPEVKEQISDSLFDLELDIDEVLTSVYRSKEDWDSRRMQVTPFHQNVTREGLAL